MCFIWILTTTLTNLRGIQYKFIILTRFRTLSFLQTQLNDSNPCRKLNKFSV